MKKKLFVVMLSVCMAGAIALAGCGSQPVEKDGNAADEGGTENQSSSGGKGYVFKANGVEIAMDMDMSTIEDKLGEPASYFEEPSCAAQGTARLFTYSGFEVDTYPDGDKDLVACVILKDDTVATPEGVDLSKTKADVIAAYGEDYTENGTALEYEKDGMTLSFILDGDNIAAIEYNSSVMK